MARSNNMEFPADLVREILLNLPVKSIIRFQCVAKNWYHLFKNPTFVSEHHSLGKKNRGNSLSLVVHYHANYRANHRVKRAIHRVKKTGMLSFADNQTHVSFHDLNPQLPFDLAHYAPLSVGDGLVCLYNFKDHGLTLWNPARKQFRVLPRCNQYIPSQDDFFIHHLGCGMDPLSNDYKVLYIRRYYHGELKNQYAIYSYRMSSDSWRVLNEEDVKIVEGLASISSNKGNTCVDGVCYWEVFPSFSKRAKVLAFHLSTEVFRLLHAPIPGANGHLTPLHDGRVAYWDQSAVWVLNDEENWTKLINIDPLPDVYGYKLFGFWMRGKVFVEYLGGIQNLWLYDLETKRFDKPGFEASRAWFFTYVESLIAVHPV